MLRAALLTIILAIVVHPGYAQTRVEDFQKVVQPYVDAQKFMGSVLVGKDGKPVFNHGYGMADLEWSVPNSPATRFNIASMTKQFTAAAILLLEDRGKLKTDDLAKKFLTPSFRDAHPVTGRGAMESKMRTILTPGSGRENYGDCAGKSEWECDRRNREGAGGRGPR